MVVKIESFALRIEAVFNVKRLSHLIAFVAWVEVNSILFIFFFNLVDCLSWNTVLRWHWQTRRGWRHWQHICAARFKLLFKLNLGHNLFLAVLGIEVHLIVSVTLFALFDKLHTLLILKFKIFAWFYIFMFIYSFKK